MRYRESGLRLLLCTSLPRYLLRVIGNLCEPGIDGNRGLDALDRSRLFVSKRGRKGAGATLFEDEREREREAALSIAPIKKLPSLSFGPVLYYVEHKVHCSFSLLSLLSFLFFSLFLISLSLLAKERSLPTPSKEIPSILRKDRRSE